MADPPDEDEIVAIAMDLASGASAVNRRITEAYHQLSEAIRADLAGPDLDWCGFAKWSSFTIGLSMRPGPGSRVDTMADLIMRHLPPVFGVLRPVVEAMLEETVAADDGLVVKALRGGNAAIFSEIGRVFANMITRLPGRRADQTDHEFAVEVVDEIVFGPAGRAMRAPITLDMLLPVPTDLLVRGIEFYLRAAREPEHRSELVLAGSMLFSVFEQTRADRLIAIGICTPFRARLVPLAGLFGVTTDPDELMLAGPGELPGVLGVVEAAIVRELTDLLLTVRIGDDVVRLGHAASLPAPAVVPVLPETAQVLDAQEQGALGRPVAWTDVAYRLGFIGRYFAAYQQRPDALLEPPPID